MAFGDLCRSLGVGARSGDEDRLSVVAQLLDAFLDVSKRTMVAAFGR